MCPVTGPVALASPQESTIALTATTKSASADSPVTLSTGWRLDKDDISAKYALSFNKQYIITSSGKLELCSCDDMKTHFIWLFIDVQASKSYAVYCEIDDVKWAWAADSKNAQICLETPDVKNLDDKFKFVFRSLLKESGTQTGTSTTQSGTDGTQTETGSTQTGTSGQGDPDAKPSEGRGN